MYGAEAVHRRRRQGVEALGAAHIGLQAQDPKPRGGLGQGGLFVVPDHHLHAFGETPLGQGQADAGGAASDHGHFAAGIIEGHGASSADFGEDLAEPGVADDRQVRLRRAQSRSILAA